MPESNLTPKQAQAIAALMTMPTVKAAAKSCGVSYSTLRAWLHDETFLHELQHAQGETIAGTVRALASVMSESVAQLAKLVKTKNPWVKLAAIRIVMSSWPALAQVEEFERRIAGLEDRLNAATEETRTTSNGFRRSG